MPCPCGARGEPQPSPPLHQRHTPRLRYASWNQSAPACVYVGMEFIEDAIRKHKEAHVRRMVDKSLESTAEMEAALHGTLGIDPSDRRLLVLGRHAIYDSMVFYLDKRDDQILLHVERQCAHCDRRLSERFVAKDKHEMMWEPLTDKVAEWMVKEQWCRSCSERMALPRWSRPLFYLGKWYEALRHRVSLAWQAGRRAANG